MPELPLIPHNGGRFLSRGKGRHEVRIIDSDELIFCVKGTLAMFENGRLFELHAGDYLLLRRGRRHGGLRDYPGGLTFFWLHFIDEGNCLDDFPPFGKVARPEQLAIYFQSFLAEQQLQKSDPRALKLLLELIFCELSRSVASGCSARVLPRLVHDAGELIKLHYNEDLSLRTAAKKLHCNPEYLGRIFHLHYHETFSDMLNRTRIEAAAKLLLETNWEIKEILHETGFNDPAYFRRIFFRRYSSTPTAFRKFYRNGHKNTV